jgi:hypothetical protein
MAMAFTRWAAAAGLGALLAAAASAAGAVPVCRYVPSLDRKPVHTEVPADPAQLDAAAGLYKLDDFNLLNIVSVTRQGEHLSAQFGGQPTTAFYAEGQNRFFQKGADQVISLDLDGAGRVKSLTLHRNHLRDLPLTRIDTAKAGALEAQLQSRLDPATGQPRSLPALNRLIAGLQSGHPDLSGMSPELALSISREESRTRSFLSDIGPVESVEFLGFMDTGLWGVPGDTYDVHHKDGVTRWHVALDSKGILTSANFRCGP